jgi:hypothetical protein
LIAVDPAVVERAGLTRVTKVRGRRLMPVADAEPIVLLGSSITAYRRPIGFGQIVMAPVDLATFRFQSDKAIRAFWAPMLAGVPERMRDNVAGHEGGALGARHVRRPHAHRPAWMLVALVVIGPLDSLLLKLLGRRPWSIVTVMGWAALFGAVVMNVREQRRERPVAYRSVRVDRRGRPRRRKRNRFPCVRWPKGATFEFPEERGAWWQPAADPTDAPESRAANCTRCRARAAPGLRGYPRTCRHRACWRRSGGRRRRR